MATNLKQSARDWQLEHYATVGKSYGEKHFTQAESAYTKWILDKIAAVNPDAKAVAEVGAGTCVFASLLGKRLQLNKKVICYEPVAGMLEGATDYDNIEAVTGGAIEFANDAPDGAFDLIFTKDTAHHFSSDALDAIHDGFCKKLNVGGRYLMVVRTPPDNVCTPVGSKASLKWANLYTPLSDLLTSLRSISQWREIQVTNWTMHVDTVVEDWIDGARNQDTWSVYSALDSTELAETIQELKERFAGVRSFEFLHEYDVAVFERA